MFAAKILTAALVLGLGATPQARQPDATAAPRATLAQLLDEALALLPAGQTADDVVAKIRADLTRKYGEGYEAEYAILGALSRLQRSRIAFNGQDHRLDRSVVAGHFVHGNDEAAVVWRPPSASPQYFLFHHGRLWKVVRPLITADTLVARIQALATRLGPPTEILRSEDGSGQIAQVRWDQARHLVRLVEPGDGGGDALLVIEELRLARGVGQARAALSARASAPEEVSDELREFLQDRP